MNKINIKQISTEARNPHTLDIDQLSVKEILEKINDEDQTVAPSVRQAIFQITPLVEKVVASFNEGGRLIYVGAGTSGRIGVLDASECPPTFGVDPEMVKGIIAGGNEALVSAKEKVEDSRDLAIVDLKALQLTAKDVVVGLAASGRTPYVLSAIEYAKQVGAATGCITTSLNTPLASIVQYPIEVYTKAEVITGSTRMKSGTAQKLVCNMITTTAMIKLGKVYQNLMVDLKATNEKLMARSLAIIKEITGYSDEDAQKALQKYQSIKGVILSYLTKIEDSEEINKLLLDYKGNIREILNNLGDKYVSRI